MIHSQNFANVANVNLLVDNILKQLVNQSSKVKLLRNIRTVLLLWKIFFNVIGKIL